MDCCGTCSIAPRERCRSSCPAVGAWGHRTPRGAPRAAPPRHTAAPGERPGFHPAERRNTRVALPDFQAVAGLGDGQAPLARGRCTAPLCWSLPERIPERDIAGITPPPAAPTAASALPTAQEDAAAPTQFSCWKRGRVTFTRTVATGDLGVGQGGPAEWGGCRAPQIVPGRRGLLERHPQSPALEHGQVWLCPKPPGAPRAGCSPWSLSLSRVCGGPRGPSSTGPGPAAAAGPAPRCAPPRRGIVPTVPNAQGTGTSSSKQQPQMSWGSRRVSLSPSQAVWSSSILSF